MVKLLTNITVLSLKSLLCDKNCFELYNNSTCFENENKNLGEVMINLAQEKYLSSSNKEDFNYLKLEANYIQTPPVF